MTPEHASVVRDTWAVLEPRADEVMAQFYALLFELAPDAKAMFARVDMALQRQKFAEMLAAMVHLLEDPEDIIVAAGPSARRHVAYGVKDRHLDAGREALIGALDVALGGQFTPAARQAWRELYDLAANVMRRAGVRAAAQSVMDRVETV